MRHGPERVGVTGAGIPGLAAAWRLPDPFDLLASRP
ncbi:Uncharacterised protein [Mycobacterium tuberculosis]|nr:Uncharacterised protein [Mycobacterium tuberculosis]